MINLAAIDATALARLADLLDYPGQDFSGFAGRLASELSSREVAAHVAAFAEAAASMSPEVLEEAHVRTFLVAPSSAPYIGVHLFGEESFKRAHLMSRLVERFRVLDFDPGSELADHLGVLLRFSARLDAEELADLVRWCLALPVTSMRDSLASTGNPYRHVLAAIAAAVAPEGVPETVRASIASLAEMSDTSGCSGCSVQAGGDEL